MIIDTNSMKGDRFIVHQLDMEDEDIGPIHDPDIIYLER